jgi:hypothetical protein
MLLLTLLPFALATAAQAQVVVDSSPGAPVAAAQEAPALDTEAIVARLMSFDRNGDGEVATMELLERMEPLMARGDADGNGALSETEIRGLARTAMSSSLSSHAFAGRYAFGDVFSFSSRSHVEGAIEDLKLPAPAKEQALAMARAFVETHEAASRARLLIALEDVLSETQLLNFQVAVDGHAERQLPTQRITAPVAGVQANAPTSNPSAIKAQVVVRVDLGRRIDGYALAPAKAAVAHAAVHQFEAGRLLGEAERAALVEQMRPILGEQERDDFRAALDRRPVVAATGVVFVSGVVF